VYGTFVVPLAANLGAFELEYIDGA